MPQAACPIYVLGLPRSGTTLAEAILSAHPKVIALGERAETAVLLKAVLEDDLPFDDAAIQTFRAEDAAILPSLPDGTIAYVDKMPENYRLIGFLKAAYPDCKIINMMRDPRDTALSMWRGHFSGRALAYTYDLRAMAERFNLYARMMRHWRSVYPDEILDVSYEALVQDISRIGQDMAAFCGLDWHDQMARPHENAAQVLTLSAGQIRQPVHTKSIGGWTAYAETLEPFIDRLDRDLWQID